MNPRNVICLLLSTSALALPSLASADNSDPTNYTPPPAPAEAPTKPGDDGMPADRLALRIAPAVFVPLGSLADATQMGGGVFAGLDYRLSQHFVLTMRGGYVTTFEQEHSLGGFTMKSSVDFAPFLGGIKWYLAEPNEGIFVAGEAGPVLAIASARFQGSAGNTPINSQASGSQTNFGSAASLGYQTHRWDLRASFVSLDLGHADKSRGVMATAAIAFAQF